jgi:antitoxin PrlF
MTLAKLTTKGQVTIPKIVRESLKLHAGDKIEIIVKNDSEAVIRPVSKKVDDIFCKLHKPSRKLVTTEAMNQMLKKRMKDNFK